MKIIHEAIYLYVYLRSKTELKKLLIYELRQKRNYRGNAGRGVNSKARIKEAQNQLNERPRHVLDYRTPKKVFEELILEKL